VLRIFGLKMDKIIMMKLHNLYSLPNIIRIMRMRWFGHVACMERGGMHTGLWCENQKKRDHLEGLDTGGKILLK
jgi:hypothetical protein